MQSNVLTQLTFAFDVYNEARCAVVAYIQTDSMKGQSEIAYLPKFANIMLIVMDIVINGIF